MPRRLLNIASIVCLVACVTLMGMWVRSYRWVDELHGPIVGQQTFTLTSRPGRLLVTFDKSSANTPPVKKNGRPLWSLNSDRYGPSFQPEELQAVWLYPAARFTHSIGRPQLWGSVLAYWFLVLVSGLLAMLFQLRWPLRFTLRSLFVVTTFVAVVLGMIAWLDRAWIGK
jgi:hypothetical protein